MSELIKSSTTPLTSSIKCQTRQATDIKNEQFPEPLDEREIRQANDWKNIYSTSIFRTNPCGYYNCHGMTFASRRTWVWEATEIQKILKEDNYKQIDAQSLLPGDIVLYLEDGDLLHSGVVVHVEDSPNLVQRVKLISKWGKCHEVVHWLSSCPYSAKANDIRFYRLESELMGVI